MIITKLSDDLTPLHKGIFFGIETESDTPSDLLVEVVNIQSGAVVAEQQLHNVTSADVNIAPYITL